MVKKKNIQPIGDQNTLPIRAIIAKMHMNKYPSRCICVKNDFRLIKKNLYVFLGP
jgi:hypothetical protein